MKCKKCGAEIAEGSLYCDKCGEDVQIVPEYDAEEFNLVQSIGEFFDKFGNQEDKHTISAASNVSEKKGRVERILWGTMRFMAGRMLIYIISAIVIIGVVSIGISLWCRKSFDYQMSRAKDCFSAGEYEEAQMACEQAITLRSSDTDARLLLAEVYLAQGNITEYESVLTAVTEDVSVQAEEVFPAYEKLIAFYLEQGRYMDITFLMSKCENQEIKKALDSYVVEAPVSELTEGSYHSVQVLKLDSADNTTIYYTLDGSQPNASSAVYNVPIVLEDGSHKVRALCVNEAGIPSMTVSYEYHIRIDKLLAPTVFPISGAYNQPQLIEIDGNIDHVYYTMDGSDPDDTSAVYTGPIAMPVGESVFKFVRIEDGNYSDMVERNYRLELTDAISVSDAVSVVVEYMLQKGKIKDYEGHVDDLGSKLSYDYQYVISLTDRGSFYIIYEYFVDYDGSVVPTGDQYAVDIYSGRLYSVELDMYYNYELVEIERES